MRKINFSAELYPVKKFVCHVTSEAKQSLWSKSTYVQNQNSK